MQLDGILGCRYLWGWQEEDSGAYVRTSSWPDIGFYSHVDITARGPCCTARPKRPSQLNAYKQIPLILSLCSQATAAHRAEQDVGHSRHSG